MKNLFVLIALLFLTFQTKASQVKIADPFISPILGDSAQKKTNQQLPSSLTIQNFYESQGLQRDTHSSIVDFLILRGPEDDVEPILGVPINSGIWILLTCVFVYVFVITEQRYSSKLNFRSIKRVIANKTKSK